MMTRRFNVTYEIITPESATDGDAAERGFEAEGVSLREAIKIAGGTFENGGRAFYTVDPERDYNDGSEKYYAIHPPDSVTRASYNRIARLLGTKTK